jgi:hypothetical protein
VEHIERQRDAGGIELLLAHRYDLALARRADRFGVDPVGGDRALAPDHDDRHRRIERGGDLRTERIARLQGLIPPDREPHRLPIGERDHRALQCPRKLLSRRAMLDRVADEDL